MAINETVLEMHFHHALMDLFRSTLGVGPQGKISFYKYSPQKECFVGFDQAWVMTDISDDALFADLKHTAQNTSYSLSNKYIGYFLQYKVVKRMVRHSKKNPPPVASKQYGRVSIRNLANETSGKSQHELLFELSKNRGALTYYACPELFEKAELYSAKVDLNKLHLVEVSTCPDAYRDNKKHYIYFDLPSMKPTWRSDPVPGNAISAVSMANVLVEHLTSKPREEAERLRACIGYLRGDRRKPAKLSDLEYRNTSDSVLQALTVLRVQAEGDA